MGFPSIGYLEACRETKNKNILGKKVGYSGGGCRQGANNGARACAKAQIIGAKVLLGSSETLDLFEEMYTNGKKRIINFCSRWMNSIMINEKSCTESAAGRTI